MFTDSLWDRIDGIVFDAVGTLIKPVPTVADVYRAAAIRQGVELDRDLVRSRFVHQFRLDEAHELRGRMVTDEETERQRWRRIVSNVLAELPDPNTAFAELWEHFGSHDAWQCFPDVVPALQSLRAAGLPVRIASNFDSRLRMVVAGLPPLASHCDALLISSELGCRKPHPRFYDAVAASFEHPRANILWIGDDLENDVRGARRAGFRSVLLDRNGASSDELPRLPDLLGLAAARLRSEPERP